MITLFATMRFWLRFFGLHKSKGMNEMKAVPPGDCGDIVLGYKPSTALRSKLAPVKS